MDTGTTFPDADSYRQALGNALLGPFTGGYINPQFATPTQIAEMRKTGATIAAPMQVHRPMEGLANVVKALVGGNMEFNADQTSQQAYANNLGAASRVAQAARGDGSNGSAPTASGSPASTYGDAIAGIESGGRYNALGPQTSSGDQALGKYQVMSSNVGPWTKEVLGQEMTPAQFLANPQAQDAVFNGKFGQYLSQTGNPQDAASMWFTGRPYAQGAGAKDQLGTTGAGYVQKFMAALPSSNAAAPQTVGSAAPTQSNPLAFMNTPVPGAYPAGASANPLVRGLMGSSGGSAGGASPADIARVLMSPFSSTEAKDVAKGLVVPTILHDAYNGYDAYRLGDPNARNIQRGTHFAPLSTPDVSTETATQDGLGGQPTTRLTVPPAPSASTNGGVPQQGQGGGAALGAPAGPLAGLAPLVGDAQQLHAQGLQTNAQAGDDVSRINAYSADGVRAKGALAQLNAIDAAGQQAPTGVAAKLQEVLGHYGIDAGKLGPLESYQAAIDAMAPGSPAAAQFKASLGTMLSTPEGRQAAVANMKLLAGYQQQIGDIASDRSMPYSARMLKIQNLGQPQLNLPGQPQGGGDPISPYRPQPATQSPAGLSDRFTGADDALAQARAAVAAGKPRAAVEQRLRQVGIDPSGL